MSRYDEHKQIEKDRRQYWVDYYAKMGIEYVPSGDLKYYRVTYDLTIDEDDVITNPAICFYYQSLNVVLKMFCLIHMLWIYGLINVEETELDALAKMCMMRIHTRMD